MANPNQAAMFTSTATPLPYSHNSQYSQNPKQAAMFTEGEDLPLFSGTPVTVRVAPFQQEEEVKQPRLPGMPALTWDELAQAKKSAR